MTIANAQQETSPSTVKETFDIWEFYVSGNTILAPKDVQRAVYFSLGPDKTIATVEQARASLEAVYKENGYPTVVVAIPEQDVIDGIVRLQVTESALERLKISGNKYFSRNRIREQISSLEKDQPIYFPKLTEELTLINKGSPDRSVVPVIRPGKTPGKVELELKVNDKLPLHGGIELSGRNTPDTTRNRLSTFISYNNLWQKEHSASFTYQISPQDRDEVEVKALTYVMPLINADHRLALYAIDSDSDVATVGDIDVVGGGKIFGTRGVFSFSSSDNIFHSLNLGFDYKDFDQTVDLGSGLGTESPIEYTLVSLGYRGNYLLDQWSFNYGTTLKFGIRGWGDGTSAFERKRAGSSAGFSYVVTNFGFEYSFLNDFRFTSEFEAQFTGSPLISNEQYSAGGDGNVRGYLQSQELADEALRASFELWTPELFADTTDIFNNLRLVGFFDIADLHTRQALPGQDANVTLSGIGIGVSADLLDHLRARVDFARALSDSSVGSDDDVEKGDHRAHFSVETSF